MASLPPYRSTPIPNYDPVLIQRHRDPVHHMIGHAYNQPVSTTSSHLSDAMGTYRVPRTYTEMPVFMEGVRYRDASSAGPTRRPARSSSGQPQMHDAPHSLRGSMVESAEAKPGAEVRHRSKAEPGVVSRGAASPLRASQQQHSKRHRITTGQPKVIQGSISPRQAKRISFDPVIEVIHVPSTVSNQHRRRRQITHQRDSFTLLSTIPPRAPELERLSTPELDPLPPSVHSFCDCCSHPRAHKYPSSRQEKLEAQMMEAKAYIARTSQKPSRIEYQSEDFVLFP
ncbi:hypothetical protein PGQ11_011754 [Apiospora arundinis]|uniref:Uncharacterized protein n=1 Tax=Apiospora arundinis TaxID=335852 RepID=A0ABR2I1E4_9PEZI